MYEFLLDMWNADSWLGLEVLVRVVVAVVLGGLVGLEREFGDKPAGFRTIVLISVGACLFAVVSDVAGGPDLNSTRIAAQIVSGIGFLGAGAILRDRVTVIGLTTAATIWSVAAIGMAAGFGYVRLAVLGTAAILVALLAFEILEKWIGRRRDVQDFYVAVSNTAEAFTKLKNAFKDAKLVVKHRDCYEEGNELVFHIVAMGSKKRHDALTAMFALSKEFTLRKAS